MRVHVFVNEILLKRGNLLLFERTILLLEEQRARLAFCPTHKEILQSVAVYVADGQGWALS